MTVEEEEERRFSPLPPCTSGDRFLFREHCDTCAEKYRASVYIAHPLVWCPAMVARVMRDELVDTWCILRWAVHNMNEASLSGVFEVFGDTEALSPSRCVGSLGFTSLSSGRVGLPALFASRAHVQAFFKQNGVDDRFGPGIAFNHEVNTSLLRFDVVVHGDSLVPVADMGDTSRRLASGHHAGHDSRPKRVYLGSDLMMADAFKTMASAAVFDRTVPGRVTLMEISHECRVMLARDVLHGHFAKMPEFISYFTKDST